MPLGHYIEVVKVAAHKYVKKIIVSPKVKVKSWRGVFRGEFTDGNVSC